MAPCEVEIDAGRGGHAEFVQPPGGELQRVDAECGREVRYVGVHVEGTVGGSDVGDAGRREPVDDDRPVFSVPSNVPVDLLGGVECGERRHLRHVRRTDVQVLLEPLDGLDHRIGHHHPADPPSGHRPVLREAVDHERLGMMVEHTSRRGTVDDAVVDLVRNHGDPSCPAGGGDVGQRVGAQHGAGRVRR